jgi:hypothetical protein
MSTISMHVESQANHCDLLHILLAWSGVLFAAPRRCDRFQTGDPVMFAKTSIALAVLVAISSGALAASKRHDATANAYGRSIDDLCRQTGPITLPATHPICNTKDFMGW